MLKFNNHCACCGKPISLIKNIVASKKFPSQCEFCNSYNYRDHGFSSNYFTFALGMGIVISFFLWPIKGAIVSTTFLLLFLLFNIFIYFYELKNNELLCRSASELRDNKKTENFKSLVGILVVLLLVFIASRF